MSEPRRIDGVEYLTHAGVFRAGVHVKEGFQVVRVSLILHPLLKFEQRRVLKEHHREGAHADIIERVVGLCSLAGIGERVKPGREAIPQRRRPEMLLRMRHEQRYHTGKNMSSIIMYYTLFFIEA
jgi:hypothetical protein